MRLKTKYREPAAENIPADDKAQAPELEPAIEDDPALALRRQIEALKRSEELQAARMVQQHQPLSREAKLQAWRQGGLSEREAHFLSAHPEMIDHEQILARAAAQATQAGHERGTDAHLHAVPVAAEKMPVAETKFDRLRGGGAMSKIRDPSGAQCFPRAGASENSELQRQCADAFALAQLPHEVAYRLVVERRKMLDRRDPRRSRQ